MVPQRVGYGSYSPSVANALWLVPPTLNKVILFSIYTPTVIKGENWSLSTVNNSTCLIESQFCVIQTVFPDTFIRTYYTFRTSNLRRDLHRCCEPRDDDYSVFSLFLCLSRMVGGGTRGNSCLGRRFLWASRSGHSHKARSEATWDVPECEH